MRTFSRLRVNFRQHVVIDFEKLVSELRKSYRIGYAGLFEIGGALSLYLQADTGCSTKMVPSKIKNICSKMGHDVDDVSPFVDIEGVAVISSGNKRFGNICKTPKTLVCTSSIDVNINALGEEDLSHLTENHFEMLFGTTEANIEFALDNMTPQEKSNRLAQEWALIMANDNDINKSGDEVQDEVQGEDDMGNTNNGENDNNNKDDADKNKDDAKKKCLHISALKWCSWKLEETEGQHELSAPLVSQFEELLLENVSNVNIRPSKNGYFHYFDGDTWVQRSNSSYFETVVKQKISKFCEFLERFESKTDVYNKFSEVIALQMGIIFSLFLEDSEECISFRKASKMCAIRSKNVQAAGMRRLRLTARTANRKLNLVGRKCQGGHIMKNITMADLQSKFSDERSR